MSASAKRCQHMETAEILTIVFTTLSATGESTGNVTDVRIRPVTPECLTAKVTFRRHYRPGGERLHTAQHGERDDNADRTDSTKSVLPCSIQKTEAGQITQKSESALAENGKQSCGKQ